MRVLGIGELLFDVFPEGERLGGAPLNLCVNLARLGHEVAILTCVGQDERGKRALAALESHGVSTRFVGRSRTLPTGIARVDLDASGSPTFALQRPAAYDDLDATSELLDAIVAWAPRWLAFGSLAQETPSVRALTRALVGACPDAQRLYDVNLRTPHPAVSVVDDLLGLATAVKLNQDEAIVVAEMLGWPEVGHRAFLAQAVSSFGLQAACVTRGPAGSALLLDGVYVEVAADPTTVIDTVGAGDAYSAGLVHGIDAGWPPERVARFAGRLAGLVASHRGATPAWTIDDLRAPSDLR